MSSQSTTLASPGPDVSFVVAAYNVAPFIEEAVRSALSQEGVTVEVIVVDDASTDGTCDIVEKLAADTRVTLIRQLQNAGPGAARNIALKSVRGRWVAILDGDDYVLAGRTAALIACAEAAGADIVGDNFERVTVDGQPTSRFLFPVAGIPYLFMVDAPVFIRANEVLGRHKFSLGAIKVLVRSDFVASHAITHPEDLPVGEDFQFILSCLFRGARFIVTSESGYKYRLRPGSQSWRLTEEHMEKLHRMQASILADARQFGGRPAVDAAVEYGQSLDRTTDFVKVVTLAKAGLWKQAALWAASHRPTWPLIIRHGGQGVLKRIQRLAPSLRGGN